MGILYIVATIESITCVCIQDSVTINSVEYFIHGHDGAKTWPAPMQTKFIGPVVPVKVVDLIHHTPCAHYIPMRIYPYFPGEL